MSLIFQHIWTLFSNCKLWKSSPDVQFLRYDQEFHRQSSLHTRSYWINSAYHMQIRIKFFPYLHHSTIFWFLSWFSVCLSVTVLHIFDRLSVYMRICFIYIANSIILLNIRCKIKKLELNWIELNWIERIENNRPCQTSVVNL